MWTKNSKKKPNLKIALKLKKSDGTTGNYHSSKTKRIINTIKRENFLEAYVKVSYGKSLDIWGKISESFNDGEYKTKEELFFALQAFTEKSLVDFLAGGLKDGK